MSVKFIWKGNPDTDDGIATYSTDTNTFDLWLPSMQRARQIEQALCTAYADGRRKGHREMMQALCTAYADGRRKGHREMMQAVTAAINETARKL